MQTLTEKVVNSPLRNRIFSDIELSRLLCGSAQSRYGLVHRALAAGEIIRIRRGFYVLDNRFRDVRYHPFSVAQALVPLSYISFETALAWHGWIPEAVHVIASVIPDRKKSSLEHPLLGDFTFTPLALVKQNYLTGVLRIQQDRQVFLLASPLRALFDLICQRKLFWSGMGALTGGLRIDEDLLAAVRQEDCLSYLALYQHQRTQIFIKSLAQDLAAMAGG